MTPASRPWTRAIQVRETQNAALTAEIARLKRLQFAARTKRMDPDQRQLFEQTLAADIAAVERSWRP
ncbi:hypothetical protein H8Z72_23745 (plasmid) [Xanthomonas citri pv. citri]|uniref:Transposase n=1 Tax=Xanthomonas citri pv. durantae TaxID=487862 RepID=A0A9X9IJ22_XANCI|nr:hypothetical protein [Xanthomonas citri]QRD62878.1 hypothetical protein H8Z74_23890 [Xanthomonas citri pv. citri]QRD67287.1 hypothetical protein H8Z73_23290 [Xanthomonas citri pv. citri]QRD71843.1 hypothetical protein H8Z72_23745 [Xanthomonas citri pv. citri]QRD76246.1 hypothetical protein H8Z71_22395 [Xanthomonas citri pv. citri]QRD80657.1 hypothetical protein H8Z70_22510 [Xanthomonas citri pv. citri]